MKDYLSEKEEKLADYFVLYDHNKEQFKEFISKIRI